MVATTQSRAPTLPPLGIPPVPPIEPNITSNISETLRQLRDPKVVEIFQVLKKTIAISNSDKPLADRTFEIAALLQIDIPL
ncbi:hypothetical protein TNCV_1574811 [Trichonephila clavipes]|nr:hypothetical protein TNCV_1574811 [Trichonephila clavipes]